MTNTPARAIYEEILSDLDIPESAYEKAEKRYIDLGQWFDRKESECFPFSPHIYPQGSFRLGTVIKPLTDDESYDLDIGCRLRTGVTKVSHTQEWLKGIVGRDLELYRKFRHIENKLEEKHRCWRLAYADELSFHMDAVPSIPEDAARRQQIREAMTSSGYDASLSASVSEHSGSITDNRNVNYRVISPDWRISNSIGYAIWFESRMKQANLLLENRRLEARVAKIDDLPARKWKTPLQRCVQILKRHRDLMFADQPDSKPISIILTTLAGRAYQGEVELDDALARILSDMGNFVKTTKPRVENPVNPKEDFADKWYDAKYASLRLEENFKAWLQQAQTDFKIMSQSRNIDEIIEQASAKYCVNLNKAILESKLGFAAPYVTTKPKVHEIAATPAKPWKVIS